MALLALLVWTAVASAQGPRVILPAPAPEGPQPAWLDNAVTLRFMEWQELDREWRSASAHREDAAFVTKALTVCTRALELPEEGQPQPGMRARIVSESCGAALGTAAACYTRRTAGDHGRRWTRGFTLSWTTHTDDCGPLRMLHRVSEQLRAGGDRAAADAEPALRAGAAELAAASAGKAILDLPPCERIPRLRALAQVDAGELGALRSIQEASTRAQLEQRWNQPDILSGSYGLVAAYHLAEAQLTLYSEATASLASASAPDDLSDAESAVAALTCLGDYRDARRKSEAAAKLVARLRAQADSEAACARDRSCAEQRRETRAPQREQPAPAPYLFDRDDDDDRGGCCKICTKGQACGDSCISRSKTCHKGPGCACDG